MAVQVLTSDSSSSYSDMNDFGSEVFNMYNENAEIFLTGVLIRLNDDDFYFGERNSSNDSFGITCTEGYMRPVVLNKISMVMDPEKETYSQTHVLLKNLSLFYKDCRVIKESHYFSGGHLGTPLYITVDVSVLIGSASIYQIPVSDENCKTAIELEVDQTGGTAVGRIFVLPISTLYSFPLTLDISWKTKIEEAVLRTSILLLSGMTNCTQWSGSSDDNDEETTESDEGETRGNETIVAAGVDTTNISLAPSKTHITPIQSSTPTKVIRKPFQKPKRFRTTTEVTMVTEMTETSTTVTEITNTSTMPTNVAHAATQMNNASQPVPLNNITNATGNEPATDDTKKAIDKMDRSERLHKGSTATKNEEELNERQHMKPNTTITPANVQQAPSTHKYVSMVPATKTSRKHEIPTASYRRDIPMPKKPTTKLSERLNKKPILRVTPKQHRTNSRTDITSPEDSVKKVMGQVSQLNKNIKNDSSHGGLGEGLNKGLDYTPMKNKEHMQDVKTSADSKDEMAQKYKDSQQIADDAEPSRFNAADTTDSNGKVEGRLPGPSKTIVESTNAAQSEEPYSITSSIPLENLGDDDPATKMTDTDDVSQNDTIADSIPDELSRGNHVMPGPEDDGGIMKDDEGIEKDDGGIMKDDEGIQKDDGGIMNDDEGIEDDDGGIMKDDEGIEKDDGGIMKDDEGIEKDDGGIMKDDDGIEKDDGGITKDDGGMKKDDEGIEKDDGGIEKDDGGIQMDDGEIKKDDGSTER